MQPDESIIEEQSYLSIAGIDVIEIVDKSLQTGIAGFGENHAFLMILLSFDRRCLETNGRYATEKEISAVANHIIQFFPGKRSRTDLDKTVIDGFALPAVYEGRLGPDGHSYNFGRHKSQIIGHGAANGMTSVGVRRLLVSERNRCLASLRAQVQKGCIPEDIGKELESQIHSLMLTLQNDEIRKKIDTLRDSEAFIAGLLVPNLTAARNLDNPNFAEFIEYATTHYGELIVYHKQAVLASVGVSPEEVRAHSSDAVSILKTFVDYTCKKNPILEILYETERGVKKVLFEIKPEERKEQTPADALEAAESFIWSLITVAYQKSWPQEQHMQWAQLPSLIDQCYSMEMIDSSVEREAAVAIAQEAYLINKFNTAGDPDSLTSILQEALFEMAVGKKERAVLRQRAAEICMHFFASLDRDYAGISSEASARVTEFIEKTAYAVLQRAEIFEDREKYAAKISSEMDALLEDEKTETILSGITHIVDREEVLLLAARPELMREIDIEKISADIPLNTAYGLLSAVAITRLHKKAPLKKKSPPDTDSRIFDIAFTAARNERKDDPTFFLRDSIQVLVNEYVAQAKEMGCDPFDLVETGVAAVLRKISPVVDIEDEGTLAFFQHFATTEYLIGCLSDDPRMHIGHQFMRLVADETAAGRTPEQIESAVSQKKEDIKSRLYGNPIAPDALQAVLEVIDKISSIGKDFIEFFKDVDSYLSFLASEIRREKNRDRLKWRMQKTDLSFLRAKKDELIEELRAQLSPDQYDLETDEGLVSYVVDALSADNSCTSLD